jgi:hypothetical protein
MTPLEILSLDQFDLPVPLPALELLFAGDGFLDALVSFDLDKAMVAISLLERRALAAAMFLQALLHGVGHPDVKGAVATTG